MDLYIKKSLIRFSDGFPVRRILLHLKKEQGDLYEGYGKLIEILQARDVKLFDCHMTNSNDFHIAYKYLGAEKFWTKLLQFVRTRVYVDNELGYLSDLDAEALYERTLRPNIWPEKVS